MSKILVTGAAGFIGFHTRPASGRGDEVVGLDNVNDYYSVQLKRDRLQQLQADAKFSFHKLEPGRSRRHSQVSRPDIREVVHLALRRGSLFVENPGVYVDSNLVGFVNILEGCRHNA